LPRSQKEIFEILDTKEGRALDRALAKVWDRVGDVDTSTEAYKMALSRFAVKIKRDIAVMEGAVIAFPSKPSKRRRPSRDR
jgi:hypothetical protein